jgi:hypothetical protein
MSTGASLLAVEEMYFEINIKEMVLGGPLKDSKILSFIPGPGNYDSNKSMLEQKGPTLKPKLPDFTQKHLLKVTSDQSRILVLEPMASSRLVGGCIMPLPNFATIQTTRSLQDLALPLLPKSQQLTSDPEATQSTYRT